MKFTTSATLTLIAISLVGCSGMMPPKARDMAQIPIIRFGDDAPANEEFILLYPAGASLPVSASVSGTLLAQSDSATLHVATKQDVYAYKQWVSFDGKTWQRSDKVISGKFEIFVPGTGVNGIDGKSPGKLSAEFNLK
ncbi:MAG: hypothetical protein HOO95_01340 [Gallionella sp.]|nr:hypothetical protein [Gallionella sp.]